MRALQDVGKYAKVDHLCAGLLEDLLPGPITILLDKKPDSDLSVSELFSAEHAFKMDSKRSFLTRPKRHHSSLAFASLTTCAGELESGCELVGNQSAGLGFC